MTYIKTSSPKPGVVLIELNRPEKRNALNNATLQNIAACLQDLEADAAVKAVVITGNTQCFAAGADLNELAQLDVVSIHQDQRPLLWKKIDEFSKPVIMAVNGYAFGAGFELALHGDMILTGDNAQFALPEIGLGMLPGAGGTQRLARLVGQQLTMRWAMTGEMISAQAALQVTLSQGLKLERQHFVWLAATQDRQEGINAFLEKRKPEFRGV